MTPHALTPSISEAPQITADDIALAAERGFRAIICNRPDGKGQMMAPLHWKAMQKGRERMATPESVG